MFRLSSATSLAVAGFAFLFALAPTATAGSGESATVSIRHNGSHIGNGVLIDSRWVLTAAHLVDAFALPSLTVQAGSFDRCLGGDIRTVQATYWPTVDPQNPLQPGYTGGVDHDIALIELSSPLALSASIQPADLPALNMGATSGVTLRVLGWWRDGCSLPMDCDRDEVQFPVLTQTAADTLLAPIHTMKPWHLGAMDPGGLDVPRNGSAGAGGFSTGDVVEGVLSFGIQSGGCMLATYPSVFTRVSYYTNWIMSTAGLGCLADYQFYGCGVNPPGSMTVISGRPKLGTTMVLGLDNPFATQNPGALAFVYVAGLPDPNLPCGTPLSGFGMDFFPPYTGELLIKPSPSIKFGSTVWTGAGNPAAVSIPVPNKFSILCLDFYAQGVIVDPTYGLGGNHLIGLTDGIKLTTGNF